MFMSMEIQGHWNELIAVVEAASEGFPLRRTERQLPIPDVGLFAFSTASGLEVRTRSER